MSKMKEESSILLQMKTEINEAKLNQPLLNKTSLHKRKTRKRKRNGWHRRNRNNKRYKLSNSHVDEKTGNSNKVLSGKGIRNCAQTWSDTYQTIIAWQYQRQAAFWKAQSEYLENQNEALKNQLEEMKIMLKNSTFKLEEKPSNTYTPK